MLSCGTIGTSPSGAKRITSSGPAFFSAARAAGCCVDGNECLMILPVRGGGNDRFLNAKVPDVGAGKSGSRASIASVRVFDSLSAGAMGIFFLGVVG